MSTTETGQTPGTKDKDYNIIWFTEACLSNALRLETYIQMPSGRATATSRSSSGGPRGKPQGAEQAKQMLTRRLFG